MELHAIFAVGIGVVSEFNSLELAQKIFLDNRNILTPCSSSKNFTTSLVNYYSEKADTRKYSNEDDVNQLKQVIKHNAFKYLETLGYATNGFDLKVPNFWLNEMQSESSSYLHNHYGANLSGTYYVEVPEYSGNILFVNPLTLDTCQSATVQNNTPFNSSNWVVHPKEGDMIFWKSDLMHSVPPAKFDGVRKSIAFDILITPQG